MMISVLSLGLILKSTIAFGVMALPPAAAGTNNWALQAGQLREVSIRSFQSGEIQQLQSEVSIIQCEQLFLAIAVGAAAGAYVFNIRRVRKASRVQEDRVKETNVKK
jgi:hypothetical protein